MTRPWPLVLLALFQVLTPVFNILFNAWVLDVSPSLVLQWLFERPLIEVFETLALMPIAGVAIYQMKRWSYVVFFGAMIWSVGANVQQWQYATTTLSLPAILVMHGLQLALGGYFLLPSVRTTYFDPTVRWWESKPRYELQVPLLLRSGAQSWDATMLNISEGGAFARTDAEFKKGDQLDLEFPVLSQHFKVPAKVVHVRMPEGGARSYGIEFQHDRASAKRFKALIRALRDLGFPDRSGTRAWYQEFFSWLSTLLKTGKGLTPQIRHRGKAD